LKRGRRLTPPSSGRATAGFACRVTPLMSNVGRHGSSRLSSKRRCISRCSRFAPMPAFARAVRPLAAGEPVQRFHQVHVAARSGCPSFGGQRTGSFSAGNSLACQSPLVCARKSKPSLLECSSSVASSRRQRTAHSAQADHLLAIARLFSEESRSQSVTNARCRSEGSQSTLRVMRVAASCSSTPRAQPLLGAAVSLFFACRPTPPSSGQPSAAAHVER